MFWGEDRCIQAESKTEYIYRVPKWLRSVAHTIFFAKSHLNLTKVGLSKYTFYIVVSIPAIQDIHFFQCVVNSIF